MGTVNFRTSDIVTLGTLPEAAYFEALAGDLDPELLPAATPWDPVADLYDAARDILSKYSFYYYHIEIRPGYYEGFSVYAGPDQTKKDIINGIKSEREYIKIIPTWYLLRVTGEV